MLPDYLNTLKDKRNLSWQDISDLSNVPIPTLRNIFSGATQNPGIQPIVAIVKALGGSLDEALDLVPSSPEQPLHTEQHPADQLAASYEERIACIKAEHQATIEAMTQFYNQRIQESAERERAGQERYQKMLRFTLFITAALIVILDFIGIIKI